MHAHVCDTGVSQQFSLLLAVVLEEQNILSIYKTEEFFLSFIKPRTCNY